MAQPPNVTDIVEEVIVAKGVVKYYITSEGLDGKTEGVFLTQDEGMLLQSVELVQLGMIALHWCR